MPNLTRFVYYACGSIHLKKDGLEKGDSLEVFYKFCEGYTRLSKFYFIYHDDDIDDLHIHYLFYFNAQVRLMTIFNKLREYFINGKHYCVDDANIGVDKCESINAYLRYMLHADESSKREGKKQYALEDIISNDDIDIIEGLINSRKGDIDGYYLRDCVLDCADDFELMNKLGLKVFHKYRYEIEILKDMRASLTLKREEERLNRLQDDFQEAIDNQD